jgi:glyoxylase-like metal-dependent hydrolase (beta-lactamase superfamily II)
MSDLIPPSGYRVRQISLGRVNAFLIRGKKPVLVDTGLPGSAPKILAALREEGYDSGDLALIIITHAHIDHFGSAAAISGITGAPVLSMAGEEDVLMNGAGLPPVPSSFIGRVLALMIGNPAPSPHLAVTPSVLVNAPYRLDEYGIDGVVIPSAGHTHGSRSIHLATGECIVGDLVMGMFPAHRPGLPIFAENMGAVKENIRRITEMKPAIIYAGHGGPFSCSQLEALR